MYPLNVIKVKFLGDFGKKSQKQFSGYFDCINQIYSVNGFHGFFKGYWIAVLGIAAYRLSYFGLYNLGKHKISNNNFLMKFFFS